MSRGQLMKGSSTCMPKVHSKNSLILPENAGDELHSGDEIHWLSSAGLYCHTVSTHERGR